MHRVLSFQMARGFGETSEYVTKRMCFSLVLSVAFLCLLGGFLLGRYAVERTLKMRADKAYLEIADNGLRVTNHLQILLLQILEQSTFDDNYITNEAVPSNDNSIHGIKGIFAGLPFFPEIIETKTCTIATVRGYREPDRYVVFSISGDGIGIAVELAKAFNRIYLEQSWRSRRTIIFCVFLGSSDFCKNELPAYTQSNVIAYIAVHGNAIQEKGFFVVSGSDMIQNMIYQAIIKIRYSPISIGQIINNFTLFGEENYLPRLAVDVPHAAISFTNGKNKLKFKMHETIPLENYRRALAQIIGISIWRLSESIVLNWDVSYFNHTTTKALNSIDSRQFKEIKDKLFLITQQIVNDIHKLNEKLVAMEKSKCLEIRMANDLLLKLDKALLCPDKDLHSKTDLVIFSMLPHENADVIMTHLTELEACYNSAYELLQNT